MSNQQAVQLKRAYRPEIDGLRAFAVVAVIINHFNQDLLPSGYLGVDIFFVISGYVITSSLAGRKSENFFDFLVGFYERRIKRLLPALIVFVLVTSVLISFFNPNPGIYIKTGLSSLIGASNIFLFSQSTDYFAQSTELNPFTHTWSLGVEEQFYLLFPIVIWFSGFGQQSLRGAKNLFFWVGVMTISSLIGFIYFYQFNQPAAYFLMPPRFWEMATGCLIFIAFQERVSIEKLLEKIPPLLVILAMVIVMLSPVSQAVISTVLIVMLSVILIACLKKSTFVYHVFTCEKIIFIGLISYSLYLWHWSVLSISRWTIGIYWWSIPFQIIAMIFLATLSYNLIETPFRRAQKFGRLATFSLGLMSVFLTTCLVVSVNAVRKEIFLGGKDVYEDNRIYHSLDLNGSSGKRLIVLGDSHAGAIGGLLKDLNRRDNFSVKMHSRGAGLSGPKILESKVEALGAYKGSLNANDSVVLVSSYHLVGEDDIIELVEEEKIAEIAKAKGASVILFRPIPYFSDLKPYRECYSAWFRPFSGDKKSCVVTSNRSDFEEQFKRVIKAQDELAVKFPETVSIFDSFSELCPSGQKTCSSSDEFGPLYRDDDHISAYAAKKMRPSFLKKLLN